MSPSPTRAALFVLPTLTLTALFVSRALHALVPWPAPHVAPLPPIDGAAREARDADRVLSSALFEPPDDAVPEPEGGPATDEPTPACVEGLALRGIYVRSGGAVAAIATAEGTLVVTTGERVGELVVESIERERAVLVRDGGAHCTLSLFSAEPAVSTTVTPPR